MNEYMRMADRMYDLSNQFEQLKKENAELKERLAEVNLNGNIVLRELTKAKEIIRTFLNMPMPNNEEVFADVGIFLTKAVQFLKLIGGEENEKV